LAYGIYQAAPEEYKHSSAKYYIGEKQGAYVISERPLTALSRKANSKRRHGSGQGWAKIYKAQEAIRKNFASFLRY
jgi:TRAP-type mannitol/chloroaromatic compound transport system substrate-binding protein